MEFKTSHSTWGQPSQVILDCFFYGTYPASSRPLPCKDMHALRDLGSGVCGCRLVIPFDYLL